MVGDECGEGWGNLGERGMLIRKGDVAVAVGVLGGAFNGRHAGLGGGNCWVFRVAEIRVAERRVDLCADDFIRLWSCAKDSHGVPHLIFR